MSYDEQYETELVRTLESFLDADGNVARTAERLFTHRHTIRYRLERVRELTSLDVSSTDGRERLSLGLKAMRVLGIVPPGGPTQEKGDRGRARARAEQRTADASLLGGRDSNPRSRDQNPVSCQLDDPPNSGLSVAAGRTAPAATLTTPWPSPSRS